MNMQSIMAQAQRMQKEITEKKAEIDKMNFVGKSELVNVTVNGKKEVVKVELKIDSIDNEDKEMLEDMILLATNKAIEAVNKEVDAKLGKYSSALNGLM